MTVLSGARVVTPTGILDAGWLRLDGARIAEVGANAPDISSAPAGSGAAAGSGAPDGSVQDLGGGWLVPGFIDLHVHGGGGHDFTTSPQDLLAGVRFHQGRGTTRTLISLMAAPLDSMCEQLGWVAKLAGRPGSGVAGAHLEGPFLATARCGAQNGAHLQPPDRQVMSKLLEAGQGFVRTVTVAPELPGALGVISDLVDAGVAAAIGHTDASYQQAMAGYAAGASLSTHLFNAMSPVDHRRPGAAVAALESGVAYELINDGVHVHPAMIALAMRSGGPHPVLITDAISATGVGDGHYRLGGLPVTVRGGQARGSDGRLSGSTLTMDEAFRRAVLSIGLPIETAVAAASTNAARVLGLTERCGAIAAGLDADLVQLDEQLRVRRVMIAGRWL